MDSEAKPKPKRPTLLVRMSAEERAEINRAATRERRSSAAFLVKAGLDRARGSS